MLSILVPSAVYVQIVAIGNALLGHSCVAEAPIFWWWAKEILILGEHVVIGIGFINQASACSRRPLAARLQAAKWVRSFFEKSGNPKNNTEPLET